MLTQVTTQVTVRKHYATKEALKSKAFIFLVLYSLTAFSIAFRTVATLVAHRSNLLVKPLSLEKPEYSIEI